MTTTAIEPRPLRILIVHAGARVHAAAQDIRRGRGDDFEKPDGHGRDWDDLTPSTVPAESTRHLVENAAPHVKWCDLLVILCKKMHAKNNQLLALNALGIATLRETIMLSPSRLDEATSGGLGTDVFTLNDEDALRHYAWLAPKYSSARKNVLRALHQLADTSFRRRVDSELVPYDVIPGAKKLQCEICLIPVNGFIPALRTETGVVHTTCYAEMRDRPTSVVFSTERFRLIRDELQLAHQEIEKLKKDNEQLMYELNRAGSR